MIINVSNEQSLLDLSIHQLQAVIKGVIAEEGQTCHEVNLYLVDTPTICQLHDQFFQDPSTTDCISFPLDEASEGDERHLGEVFVCPETALNYVKQHGGSVYDEILLYIVHGLLHLMGYDDVEDDDRQQMRQAEERHLQALKRLGLSLQPAHIADTP